MANTAKKTSRLVFVSIVFVVSIILMVTFIVVYIHKERKITDIDRYSRFFKLEATRLESRINEIDSLHHLVINDPTIANVFYKFDHDLEPTAISRLMTNKILNNISQIQYISAAYLLAKDGLCRFSSVKSFIGKNYGFRPYFTEALKKGKSVYLARGVTSHVTGIYFSHAIELNGEKMGVAVLKIDPRFFQLKSIFSFSSLPSEKDILRTGLATNQGILLNTTENILNTVENLTEEQRAVIRHSKQFPEKEIIGLGFPRGSWIRVKKSDFSAIDHQGKTYYFFSRALQENELFLVHIIDADWFHRVNAPLAGLYNWLLVIFGLLLVVACGFAYLLEKRQYTILLQSEALAESEKKIRLFSQVVEQAGSSIVITDAGGNIVYVNPHFTTVTGYGFDEAYGRNPRILNSGRLKKSVYREMWQTITSGNTWKGVLHNIKKNGEMYWEEATVSPIVDSGGEITHFVAVKEDISERISLTERLKEESEKLQLIVKHAGLGITIIVDRRFVWINRTCAELFGYSEDDEIVGQLTEMMYPSKQAFLDFAEEFVAGFEHSDIFTAETRMKRKDGSLFWVNLTGKSIESKDVDGDGYIWIIEDITQRKRDEVELLQAKEKAEAANEMKSRILTNVSHDIRTPLHGLIGTLDLLASTALSAVQKDLLLKGKRAAVFLENMLNNLLDLSKIESGQFFLEESPFVLKNLIVDTGEILAGQFSSKGIAFKYSIDESLPEVFTGDGFRLQQILINLVGNSLKFTHEGSIALEISGTVKKDMALLLFQVNDTGVGIPEENREQLFEPFTQADNSITRKYGGSGLGLSICKELCTMMGGRIWFETEEGKGTTFYFTCKCGVATEEEKALVFAGEEYVDLKCEKSLVILIVDDNEANQEILKMMLQHGGHKPHIAANGRECLEKMASVSFDLIFMDMQMPVLDGLSTAEIIRSCEQGSGETFSGFSHIIPELQKKLQGRYTPIVALTANAGEEDRNRCRRAGMDHYLLKPFRNVQIAQVLHQFCGKDESVNDFEKDGLQSTVVQADVEETALTMAGIREYIETVFPFSLEERERLIALTLEQVFKGLEELRIVVECESPSLQDVAEKAHKIKGSLLNLGLKELASDLSALEQLAREKKSRSLEKEVGRILSEMNAIRQRN
ncbi:PAS domain S-box protein [Desulfomarina sp.]